MLRNYFKTAFRNLLKNKVFSFLNILGLAVGMASCFFIFQYVHFEKSYDRFFSGSQNIYRVTSMYTGSSSNMDNLATNHPGTGPALKANFPEVEDFARVVDTKLFGNATNFSWKEGSMIKSYNEEKVFFTDDSFFKIFNYRLLEGNPVTCLSEPGSVVMTRSVCKKYFGNSPGLGQVIQFNGNRPLKLTGIVEDQPENTHLKFNALISFETLQHHFGYDEWDWGEFYNYVLLRPGTDPKSLEKKFPAFITKLMGKQMAQVNYGFSFQLQPLTDIHLRSNLMKEAELNGNSLEVTFLTIIGLFVLAIAWINYINLSTARSTERAREVGLRKVVGAGKHQLLLQFLFDSVLTNLLALALAIVLILSSLPFLKDFLGKDISAGFFTTGLGSEGQFWITVILLFFCGALLVGMYPAYVLSSFKPTIVLKGLLIKPGQGISLRKVLVTFQFVLSLVLIAGALIVSYQLFFMRHTDPGYQQDQRLVIKTPAVGDSTLSHQYNVFRNEILQNAAVTNMATTSDIPGGLIRYQNNVRREGQDSNLNYTTNLLEIDENFIPVFGMHLLSGRNFTSNEKMNFRAQTGKVLINEGVMKDLGFKGPDETVNQRIQFELGNMHIHADVIGVIKNFHQRSFREAYEPILFYSPGFSDWKYFVLNIHPNNNQNTIASIEKIYKNNFPGNAFDAFFMDDFFNQQYQGDQRLGKVFGLFTFLAILVSCLGLLGLSSFLIHLRTREVGIRKVLGASVWNVLMLFSVEFVKLILISSIIAVPVIYFSAGRWLMNYAFHIRLNWFFFVVPALLLLCVSMMIVWWQTLRVGLQNPIKALRLEA